MSEEWKVNATMWYEPERNEANSRAATIRNLAERLFVADYPTAGVAISERVAKEAFDAAEAFLAEAERRAEACK